MKEFFGIGGYQRSAEGFLSWQHLTFVTALMILMALSAIWLGKQNKYKTYTLKNKVLIWTAFLIDGFELFKIGLFCYADRSFRPILMNLPLFLCSIQLIAIPIAAFSKGRLKQAALDFVFIFGILGAVLGTYGAGNNYGTYPVLGFDNVVSGITHILAGFASLYIAISGMASMKKKNIPFTFAILLGFCGCAAIANKLLDYNYMFLVRGDGTPYDLIYNLVGGNPIIYPMTVILLFIAYILAFYGIYFLIQSKKQEKAVIEEKEEVLISQ